MCATSPPRSTAVSPETDSIVASTVVDRSATTANIARKNTREARKMHPRDVPDSSPRGSSRRLVGGRLGWNVRMTPATSDWFAGEELMTAVGSRRGDPATLQTSRGPARD